MTDVALKAPGLYVRALETAAPPASRTALTAFVGVAERGPLHAPELVRSFGDFVGVFGAVWDFGALGASVHAFFLNGGEEACIVRVAAPDRAPPAGPCSAVENVAVAEAPSVLDADGRPTLHLSAHSPGSWGNHLRVRVVTDAARDMDLARTTAIGLMGASAIQVDAIWDFRVGGRIKLSHALNPFLQSVHRVMGIDPAQRRLDLDPALPRDYPVGSAVSGPGFRLEASDGTTREVFDGLSVNPAHTRHFVSQINGPKGSSELELARSGHSLLLHAAQLLDGGGQPLSKPASLPELVFSGGGDGMRSADGSLAAAIGPSLVVTARKTGRVGNGVEVRAEPFRGRLALAVPETAPGAKDRLTLENIDGWSAGDDVTIQHPTIAAQTETVTIDAVDSATHELSLHTALINDYPIGSECSVAKRFSLFVEGGNGVSESFLNLSMSAGPHFVSDVLEGVANPARHSELVCVALAPAATDPPVGSTTLGGGSDPDEVPLEHVTGYLADGSLFQPVAGPERLGLAALEAVPEVSLISLPDIGARVDLDLDEKAFAASQALQHCRRLGERFFLADVPRVALTTGQSREMTPAEAHDWPSRFSDAIAARYGALYYPWLRFPIDQRERLVPPSAAAAGLIARADREDGVGRAPANLRLKGAIRAELELDAEGQGELNLVGVNCIRKFEVGALRLWGARSLSREAEFLYVHQRRVVLLIVKTLSSSLRWAVFEPNDSKLRQRLKDSLDGFLRGLLAGGLTAGQTPEESFYVKVHDLDSAAEGQVVAELGVALSKPAEFVVIAVKKSPEILTLVEEEA